MNAIPLESRFYTDEELAQILLDRMRQRGDKNCICCAMSMRKSAHHLSLVQVHVLDKMMAYVSLTNENDIVTSEMPGVYALTHIEKCNVHKLTKHGLIAKIGESGKRKHYCITRKGGGFITGRIQVPRVVYSFRNKTIERSDDMVTVTEILGNAPYCDDPTSELVAGFPTYDELERVRVSRAVKASGKRKKTIKCLNCVSGIMKRSVTAEIIGNVARTKWWLVCDKCDHREELND